MPNVWQITKQIGGNVLETIKKQIGKNLALARKKIGMTQQEVGEKFDSGRAYISQCESGGGNISLARLHEFSLLYGQELIWFFQENIENGKVADARAPYSQNLPEDLEKLATALVKMLGPQKSQRLVICIMEAVASAAPNIK